jgi:hypothetical protein
MKREARSHGIDHEFIFCMIDCSAASDQTDSGKELTDEKVRT